MKKVLLIVTMFIFFLSVDNVNAKTVNSSEIGASTYVIGRYMYTRDVSSETGYDGRLTTKRIMLAARTITGATEESMIIYYKTASGSWINALTGEGVNVPETFEIDVEDLVVEGEVTISNPNYETYELNSSEIASSTYVIGDYMYTRNQNESHSYDGRLTTQRIMLASKTITGTNEEGMIIYYKTARGVWIDALTGVEVTAPQKYNISVVDLINQKTEEVQGKLLSGSEFNIKIKELAGNKNVTTDTVNETILSINKANSITQENMQEENIISSDDSGVTIYAWFDNGIIYYYPYHYFDNVNVYLNEDSSNMLCNLIALYAVDLSNLDASAVVNTSNIFYGSMISTLITPMVNSTQSILLPTSMYDSSGNKYTELTSSTPTKTKLQTPAMLVSGTLFNEKIKFLAENDVASVDTLDENITKIKRERNIENIPEYVLNNHNYIVSVFDDLNAVYAWYDNGTMYYYSESSVIFLNADSSNMFRNLGNLTEIDLDDFNTSQVTNMSNMFYICNSLINLDLSMFDTSNVTSMNSMFYGCNNLENLNISSFDTTNVTDMYYMFGFCKHLGVLDLSSFDIGNTTDTRAMFSNSNLVILTTPKSITNQTISLTSAMYDSEKNKYTELNSETPTSTRIETPAVLIYGRSFNERIKKLAGDSSATADTSNTNITKIKRETNVNNVPNGVLNNEDYLISVMTGESAIYAWFDNGTIYYYTKSTILEFNPNSSYMFNKLSGLTEIDLSVFDTSIVTNMSYMFSYCRGLTTLDLSSFDTSNVTDMSYMFMFCSALTSINLTGFDTSSVTNMYSMFQYCGELSELDLSSFDINEGTSVSSMLSGATITALVTPNSVSQTVVLPYAMFDSSENKYNELNSGTPSKIRIERRTTLMSGLNFNKKIKKLAGHSSVDSWTNDSNITRISRETNVNNVPENVLNNEDNLVSVTKNDKGVYAWFNDGVLYYYSASEIIYLNSDSSSLFGYLGGLSSIVLSDFDTSDVVNMSHMFYGCKNLTSINLSNFDTSSVTNMSYMFSACDKLTSIDLSGLVTNNVTDMSYMFMSCYKLASVNLTNFNTTNVINMSSMFANCNELTSLNLSSFETNNVTNMSSMFSGCSGLTNLNLNNFITINVTNMSSMFYLCSELTSLNLSNFNTEKVTNMNSMFRNCSKLTSLNISSFNTASVTDMSNMFNDCEKLSSLNLSSFNTENVTDMGGMFTLCYALTSLDLSNFVTTNVTDMGYMFYNCTSLSSLNISGFDMSSVEDVEYMFRDNPLTILVTPKVNPTTSISLPRTMYAQGNGTGITAITSTTPTETTLKNTTW